MLIIRSAIRKLGPTLSGYNEGDVKSMDTLSG